MRRKRGGPGVGWEDLPADIKASGGTEGAAYVKKFTKRVVKQMPPAADGERPGILNRFAYF